MAKGMKKAKAMKRLKKPKAGKKGSKSGQKKPKFTTEQLGKRLAQQAGDINIPHHLAFTPCGPPPCVCTNVVWNSGALGMSQFVDPAAMSRHQIQLQKGQAIRAAKATTTETLD